MFFVKQKTAYEMLISDWSSDVCSSDLPVLIQLRCPNEAPDLPHRQGRRPVRAQPPADAGRAAHPLLPQNGRVSCRERVCQYVSLSVVAGSLRKKSCRSSWVTHKYRQKTIIKSKQHHYKRNEKPR